jgi:hypothetical protein
LHASATGLPWTLLFTFGNMFHPKSFTKHKTLLRRKMPIAQWSSQWPSQCKNRRPDSATAFADDKTAPVHLPAMTKKWLKHDKL